MLTLAIAGFAFAAILMLGVWLVAVRVSNAGLVDVAWSASFTGLVAIYVAGGSAGWPRSGLIVAITAIWSLRLTAHLWRRVVGEHPREDTRYAELRQSWAAQGLDVNRRFFWFFQVQARRRDLLRSPPMLVAAVIRRCRGPVEWVGASSGPVGLIGEAAADGSSRVQGQPGHRGAHLPAGPLALLAPSELLLRVDHLGGLLPRRAGLARSGWATARLPRC